MLLGVCVGYTLPVRRERFVADPEHALQRRLFSDRSVIVVVAVRVDRGRSHLDADSSANRK